MITSFVKKINNETKYSRGNSRPKLRPAFGRVFKNLFYQKQCKYATNIGVAQIRGALL